jgi:hypothetical protein
MDLIRCLVALQPRDWRERYGAEFAALLLTAAVALTVSCETAAKLTGLAVNVLWLPTDPLHTLALLGVVGPWAALIIRAGVHRRAARRS